MLIVNDWTLLCLLVFGDSLTLFVGLIFGGYIEFSSLAFRMILAAITIISLAVCIFGSKATKHKVIWALRLVATLLLIANLADLIVLSGVSGDAALTIVWLLQLWTSPIQTIGAVLVGIQIFLRSNNDFFTD